MDHLRPPTTVMTLIFIIITTGLLTEAVPDSLVLRHVNTVYTTESRWLAALSVDHEAGLDNLNRLQEETTMLINAINRFINHHSNLPRRMHTAHHFSRMQHMKALRSKVRAFGKQVENVNFESKDFVTSLFPKSSRTKRSLLPFLGDILSGITGVATDKDIKLINKHLSIMQSQNERLGHIVQDSITVVNASKVQLTKVTGTVNDLITAMKFLKANFDNVTEYTFDVMNQTEVFYVNWLDISLHELVLHDNLNLVQNYIQKFHSIVSTALLGQVTPLLIKPSDLKVLLSDIKERIDSKLQLPFNLESQLHEYYQQLKCDIYKSANGIGIVLSIPLVSIDSQFNIFKVYNVPVPYGNTSIMFKYDVQHNYIALSMDRSRFTYLETDEYVHCSIPTRRFCHITSPTRFVSHNLHYCIVEKLYLNTIKQCKIIVVKDVITLPHAVNLEHGDWLIVSDETQMFTIMCNSTSYQVQVEYPVGHLHLPLSCNAQSQWLRLPSTYYQHSAVTLMPPLSVYHNNITIIDYVPNQLKLKMLKLPQQVRSMVDNGQPLEVLHKRISDYLTNIDKINFNDRRDYWLKAIIPVVGIIIVVLIVSIVVVKRKCLATTHQVSLVRSTPTQEGQTAAPPTDVAPPASELPFPRKWMVTS